MPPNPKITSMENIWIQVLTALIAAGASVAGALIAVSSKNKEIIHQMEMAQAITDTKLQTLTDEVRKHNNFAERVPIMETDIKNMRHEINEVKDDLKNKWV